MYKNLFFNQISNFMKQLRLLLLLLFAVPMFSWLGNSANAQHSYTVSSSVNAGNPGGVTFGETTTTGWGNAGIAGTISTNVWSPTITLPFSFNFFGTPVTECKVSANGLLTFTTSVTGTPPNANGSLPDASLPDNTIAALWDEFTNAPPTGSNDLVYYFTLGTAPNRQFWVYWFSFEYGNPSVSFQYSGAVLEETTNKVYVVDVYGTTTPLLTATVGVQKDATTAIQFGSNVAQAGNSTGNADNDYWAFSPILLLNDNAGITGVTSPAAPFTAGSQSVNVTLKNFGSNALTSANVEWMLNGVAQTSGAFSGSLPSLGTTTVTLGNATFNAGNNTIKAWSSLPNGVVDAFQGDDTLTSTICTGLSGTYTIAASGADYTSVAAAVSDLANCGLNGAVTFNIAAGTYTGAINIPAIAGASATNTVTFNGAGAASTIITYDGSGSANATITLNGADYVTFSNVTINNTEATADGWGVLLTNQANNNTINNCIINVDAASTGSGFCGVVTSGSTTSISATGNNANYTTISNTTINGGYYGVRFYGNTSANADNTNNKVENCTFTNTYGYVVYGIYQDGMIVRGNTMSFRSTTTFGYGVYNTTSRHSDIQRNIINGAKTYGISLLTENAVASNPTMRSTITNNMVTALGTGDGIYLSGGLNVDIFYNSVTAETDQALWVNSTSTGYDIRNNIFAASGAEPVDFDGTPTNETIDYNIYYRSGAGNLALVGTATYADLAAWKTADATKNAASLSGDPSFLGTTNLHVQGTLANGTGTPISGVTTDIDGDTRNATTPDIGADEFAPPSCVAPSGLMATNLSFTGATLGWTAGSTETSWDVEYGVSGFTQGTGTMVSATTSNPLAITGLTGSTTYQFYVRAICGGSTSTWGGPYSFFTGYCTPAPSSVDGTGITNVSMGTVNNTTGAETGNYGNYSAQVVSAAQGLPLTINITYATGYTYNTWAWVDWNDDLDFNDANEEQYLGESSSTNPTVFTGTLNVPVSAALGNHRLRIGGADSGLGTTSPSNPCYTGAYGTFEDYTINVIAAPSCLPPTTLTATNATATGASLGWTALGTETAWDIEWGASGFTQGTGTTVTATTTNPYALSGLSANTAYQFYVRANCGGSTSSWSGPFTFTTPCVAYNVPYFEGFETGYANGTAVAGCLSQQSVTGTSVWTANNTLTTYNRAPRTGGWNAFLQYGNDDWLFIPINLTGGTSYTFECYARQDMSDPTYSNMTVSYGSSNSAAAMTNAIVPATSIINGNYQQIMGSFTPSATGTYYIGIKGYMSGTPWYISLDDIAVYPTPTCVQPTALNASNITFTGATLGWTSTAASWQVQYGTAGFALGTGTTVATTTNPVAITGLTGETTYGFYVRSICAVGDTSPWAGPMTFYTGYCIPAPTSVDAQGITNVTMGTINNTTVAETGNYGNYSSLVTDVQQGATVNCAITFNTLTYDYNTKIWVDWNGDLDFNDAGEEVYSGLSASTSPNTLNASFVVPANAALGNYRLRIGGIDSGTPTPCYTGSYGTYEDYTINVILPLPTLAPFTLIAPANNALVTVAGPAQTPINVSWHKAGNAAGVTYVWRAALLNGTPILALPSDNMGMDTTLSLNVQTIDGWLAALGVPVGDTATLQWTVTAHLGADSLFATTPHLVNLWRIGVSTPNLLKAPLTNGATTQVRAPNGTTSHTYLRAATIVLPSEFTAAGIASNNIIRNFGFNTSVAIPAGSVTGVFKLYLQNTTDATYNKGTAWTGIATGMTEVFNDTITINGGGNAWDVVLDTLFTYAGNAVYVAYDWQTITGSLAGAITYTANNSVASSLVSASSTTAPPATLGGSSFRPEFSWGIDREADDLEVSTIYALGKNPIGYSAAEQVQAIVKNNGYLPATKAVSLNITGANTFTATENVFLLPGTSTTVTFSGFTATAAGFNNVVVSVPADQKAANNSKTWVQESTTNTFAYADSTTTGLGGVGYNTSSGLLLNRYFVNGAASVSAVKVRLSTNAATTGNTVYAVLVDTSGTILAQSANLVVAAGDLGTVKTFTFPTPINVNNADILVGLAQTANATGYFPIAYQTENPTRANAYFGADLNGANIGAVNNFRLMIEAVVGPACNVTGTAAVTNISCNGETDGAINLTGTGNGTLTFAWSNGATTEDLTGLSAGSYSVVITDANGCVGTDTFSISEPTALALSTSAVSDTASTGVGSASVVATGGTAPYTYAWSNGGTTATITGVTTGTYTVTVTDANGCESTSSVLVDNDVNTNRAEELISTLSIFPNPSSGFATIKLELAQLADVNVNITNISGQVVQNLGNYSTTSETFNLDLSNLVEGVYFVRFVVEGHVITRKLVIVK
jgi:hypothetical protein